MKLAFLGFLILPGLSLAQGASAPVDQYLGSITGLTATLHPDGTLNVVGNRIVTEDGRVLVARPTPRSDGNTIWDIQPSAAEAPKAEDARAVAVKPLDFVVSRDSFIGKAVLFDSVVVIAFDRDHGYASLPGMSLDLDFSGVDKASIRQILEHCIDFMPHPGNCSFRIQGIVARKSEGDRYGMSQLVMQPVALRQRR